MKTETESRHKNRYYYKHSKDFRRELHDAIPRDVLRELHCCSAKRHFSIVLRQFLIAALAVFGILHFDSALIWLPCSIALGFVIFDFSILLHEVIHNAVFEKRRPGWNFFLGWLYALPCGLSRSQFTRWHLDHHQELGSSQDDPKRAHLTPKKIKRWYKFLYMTPALFPIYFRAAAQEVKNYSLELQRTIRMERRITLSVHFLAMFLILFSGGVWTFIQLYAIPYFFVFPVAFTINRLGQHYNVNPNDAAQWSTLMKGSCFWDHVYLYSNYHLEHHYFPAVPFYNLPELQKLLQPFYNRHKIKPQTYSRLLYGWFIENRIPHTDWSLP
ncbi:MAG: fatty acid desaturase [Candidatus Omnitrophica bacterium]|nr:fatty acid desaturase [Candidatus Omnitrophota bacterium]